MANASANSRAHVDERDAKRLYSNKGAGLLPVTGAACRKMLQKAGCDFTKPPERFRAKWTPVRVKKTRQNKKLELRF
ncbi:hypothetical protein [Bradyrhizobium sp. UNPF46]|uniref:hypothetical protein n=1 Tax=Bradyrhizobium sp. UNPF46 TaxID=1141168 RepID=UPI001152D0CF|nr:hypothetical protein [Bradyrhizobium sp. UNPF46]